MGKRLICLLISVLICIPAVPAVPAEIYSDVPEDSWAEPVIYAAKAYGLMGGTDGNLFGYGKQITRGEFVTILCRMFEWTTQSPESPSFPDVSAGEWFFPYVEAALSHGAVTGGGSFYPNEAITREDMAVMLVRALGYDALAGQVGDYGLRFEDVSENKGYITIAYDIGMINGVSQTSFAPGSTAKREEAAAMLVRVYEKYIGKTTFLHGFYAFSSYDQRNVIQEMDAVSFGWSRMCWSEENGARLNTGAENDNQWRIPSSYESITEYVSAAKVKAHLDVYMDTSRKVTLSDGQQSNELRELLLSPESRKQAVQEIINEVSREYELIGRNPYSGVTIDFEGLKGAELKAAFTAFLTELSAELGARKLLLYVAVQPATPDGIYFDGFDYREIGRLADKVILMAHDYNATSLEGFVGTQWHKTTALTPFSQVYYSLKMITDGSTGVEDRSKIALALSFSTLGWEITADDTVLSPTAVRPSVETLNTRLKQPDTVRGWSEVYRNPYASYTTESGQKIFIWYEDERSVSDKIELARLFGVSGVSVWRIGIIPDYAGGYDVWSTIK
jgi:spore germination protein YaaH